MAEARVRELEAALAAAKSNGSTSPPPATAAPLFRAITAADLVQIARNPKPAFVEPLVAAMNAELPKYGVNTPRRVAYFLSQMAHESDNFRTMEEYASGVAYEGRAALGNTEPGDGPRYKGRGILQLAGRKNYREIGQALGLDLENNPTLAADPGTSVRIAAYIWQRYGLNELSDTDDVTRITRRINGGLNGIEDRMNKLSVAKAVFGVRDMPSPPATQP